MGDESTSLNKQGRKIITGALEKSIPVGINASRKFLKFYLSKYELDIFTDYRPTEKSIRKVFASCEKALCDQVLLGSLRLSTLELSLELYQDLVMKLADEKTSKKFIKKSGYEDDYEFVMDYLGMILHVLKQIKSNSLKQFIMSLEHLNSFHRYWEHPIIAKYAIDNMWGSLSIPDKKRLCEIIVYYDPSNKKYLQRS